MKWRTATGQVMDVKEMTSSHIKNSISMLKRQLEARPATQVYVGDSDHGNDWVEQENRHNDEIEKDIKSTISSLERELKRRELATDTKGESDGR